MFVIESAIHKSAVELGKSACEIQKNNLIQENDTFYYGQKAERVKAEKCWAQVEGRYRLAEKVNAVSGFNKNNKSRKKGISMMPVCFGISFTNTMLNQASALVHIYTDGTISVSTAAVEMGQGVNEKMIDIAASVLSIDKDRVKVESTNTTRVANTSATAASSGADLNGNALIIACTNLLERLKLHAASLLNSNVENISINNSEIYIDGKKTNLGWNELINSVYVNRISLTAQAYYATPDIYFNRDKNQGRPFAYHVYGTALTIVTVDCLRGTYEIDSVEVVHDFGKSLNRLVDLGQAEGGIVQGIGWMTIEELLQDNEGRLKSNSLSTYKIPDIYSAPKKIDIHFLEDSENPYGPFKSKAIGEPPFMYGIGTYFAIVNAVKEFNPIVKIKYSAPVTHEKTLMMLYDSGNTGISKSGEHESKLVTELS
jgi:xanthine dehydrogenase large subunit